MASPRSRMSMVSVSTTSDSSMSSCHADCGVATTLCRIESTHSTSVNGVKLEVSPKVDNLNGSLADRDQPGPIGMSEKVLRAHSQLDLLQDHSIGDPDLLIS